MWRRDPAHLPQPAALEAPQVPENTLEQEHVPVPLTPEQRAREEIDEQLESCGWVIQDFTSMNIHAGLGVAVRASRLTVIE